ncbi:hypothetical protein FRB94_009273 [Tulasnella sp. JGI-2019a]|nr:hypothetical protein FRB94_009273 [Tulasnella sp. JGI-2019a]KAG9000132.1 hypothetical protein FRB93_012807 [Tulasnella sp. JGI-2019a]
MRRTSVSSGQFSRAKVNVIVSVDSQVQTRQQSHLPQYPPYLFNCDFQVRYVQHLHDHTIQREGFELF